MKSTNRHTGGQRFPTSAIVSGIDSASATYDWPELTLGVLLFLRANVPPFLPQKQYVHPRPRLPPTHEPNSPTVPKPTTLACERGEKHQSPLLACTRWLRKPARQRRMRPSAAGGCVPPYSPGVNSAGNCTRPPTPDTMLYTNSDSLLK
jgi:hypothetical protein